MEYVLICVTLVLLAGVFVLFYKMKQLESDKQQLEFEKTQSMERYQSEIAATVANYEEKQETLKNVERKKYHNLKESTAKEVESMRMMKNQLAVQHNKERNEMEQKHSNDIYMLQNLITELRAYSKNSVEMNTHEILTYMKRGFIQQGILTEDEIHIIPNVFVPNTYSRKGNKSDYTRVDHLVLCTTGIYVLETKEWQGILIHGLTKENAGVYSFMIDEIGMYQNKHQKEETFTFVTEGSRDKNSLSVRVENEGNPAYKVQHASSVLYHFLTESYQQGIKETVKPLLYFGNETSGNRSEVIDLSSEALPRLNGREQLVAYFRNERLKGKTQYTVKELEEIKAMIDRVNDMKY